MKASVSISAQQEAFARTLVEAGRYPSLSAVVQRGLDLLRDETERQDAERALLKALLEERAAGAFVTIEEGRTHTAAMLADKRRDLGL